MSFDLPDLPDGWSFASLESCSQKGSITYGIVQPGTQTEDGVPIIRVNNFRDTRIDVSDVMKVTPEIAAKYERTRLKGGEVLLTVVGTVGQVAVAPSSVAGYNVARAVAVIHPLPHVSAEWIALCLRSPYSQYLLESRANTTVQTTINLKDLRALPIPLPPERERASITEMVGAIDDRITLLRETNTTLEAIAQALFKSWFVDFDPVHAKMQGRAPEGMDEATAALFPDSFEESELGAVPKGWKWMPLNDAYEINPTRKLKKGETAPYLDMAGVQTQGHSVGGVVQREMGSGTKFMNGDTLLARITPCLENGKTAFVDFLHTDQTGWGSTEFVVLRPKAPLPQYHAYLLARHPAFREHAIRSMSGTSGRQRIQNDVLSQFLVAVPNEPIAKAFSELVMTIHESIREGHLQVSTLSELRDTLLPRLISGRVDLQAATTSKPVEV
jgi:type I restriction enzyme S subunit